ncbi:uncharacterized protein LOC132706013 isoform X2 [Cylas formicarius]|uniref:uncharacterized protein LOC132706013 isoform X2 n=1 Tax=Cylas formicarius TaxID=197179 RepID=UPI0029584A84|nr:uncharacterized protein LOC132706013 isoform X2 [Cylas formicarius]
MEMKKDKLTCQFCNLGFSSTSTKNRHIKTKHSDQDIGSAFEGSKRNGHIICPICPNKTSFPFHRDLIKHLNTYHNLTIKESTLYFRNVEEFLGWKAQENRGVKYACLTRRKDPRGEEKKVYECNRSDYKGFVSSAKKRSMKTGGSIHIRGTCPSRIIVTTSAGGSVIVKFVETHVGHSDELRTKRLKSKQEMIAPKLTNQRIMEETRLQIPFEEKREIILQEMNSFARSLDKQSFSGYVDLFRKFEMEHRNAKEHFKKRKINKKKEVEHIILSF